jgi:hypothetical protein
MIPTQPSTISNYKFISFSYVINQLSPYALTLEQYVECPVGVVLSNCYVITNYATNLV